jgi:hypothetical protein
VLAIQVFFTLKNGIAMITSLVKIREDKLEITESMSIDDIAALGLTSTTVAVRWDGNAGTISMRNEFGLWAQVLPRRDGVAIKQADDETGKFTFLKVYNEDGSERFRVSNYQFINGADRVGVFAWYEEPRTSRPNCFAVVFVVLPSEQMYQLDIDAGTGDIVGCYSTR